MIQLMIILTIVFSLIAIAFPEHKETMYGCIVSMWKFLLYFIIGIFILIFIGAFISGLLLAL